MKYFLSQRGKQVGPWTIEEIVKKLQSKHLVWTDYLYDEASQDWVLLMEHPQFVNMFKSEQAPPPVHPFAKKDFVEISKERNWFVLRGENKHGPFAFLDVVKLLQDKKIFEFDFVWQQKWPSWKKIADAQDFKPEHIKALKEAGGSEVSEVFFRRRHTRIQYGASLVVHNNKSVWQGESLEISAGGASIVIKNNELQNGQSLFLHFKAGDGVPPFNAICIVVSKSSVEKSAEKNMCRYGVKFTNISQDVQLAIKKVTDRISA